MGHFYKIFSTARLYNNSKYFLEAALDGHLPLARKEVASHHKLFLELDHFLDTHHQKPQLTVML